MVWLYNIDDIKLGKPSYSGHETYVDAVYMPAEANGQPSKVIFKKNKHGQEKYSRFEVAFSQLARLFLAKGTTSQQKLVVDKHGQIVGVATEHLCYVIARNEGESATFFTLADPTQNCDCISLPVSQAEEIPYYFFDKLPHGFFATLLQAEKENKIDIDFASLASIFTSSYTLEEDDLHKGNFGFYIVKKNGRPQVVFFKIDHDLMLADSIMSFNAIRPLHLFHGANAFDITAEDLINFPNLSSSLNIYWPTKLSFITKPWDPKAYLTSKETQAFSFLADRPEFKRAKWLMFYKHILLSEELVGEALDECLDDRVSGERAKIALLTDAAVARQARLKAVLFSIKEFRDCIASLTPEEHAFLLYDLVGDSAESEVPTEIISSMFAYQELCQSQQLFEEGDTPLHTAIKLGDYRYEETIQMFGHFINVKNKAGQTPLDVAIDMQVTADKHPDDIRKDARFTMQHLLENGAEKSEQFELFNEDEHIESYKFKTAYRHKAGCAKTYNELKNVLKDIGEDHSFCLKSKKNIAIECVKQFIRMNNNHSNLQAILKQLKRDINGESSENECSPLLYIRQLRSRLWIIRLIRGLYGTTSTQTEINDVVDKELERIANIDPKILDAKKAQEAKAQEAAEEHAIKEQLAKHVLTEVDELLGQIAQNKHQRVPNVPELCEINDELHQTLTQLRDEYETHLKTGKSKEQNIDPVEAWALFSAEWQSAIETYEGAHTKLAERLEQPLKKVAEEAANVARAKRTGVIIGRIDKVLDELQEKIHGIDNSHLDAKDTANNLYTTLLEARDDYFVQLTSGKEHGVPIDADNSGELFKARCKSAIDFALPILEQDLDWGSYLINVLKALFNAVVYILTAGNTSGFFAYSKSEASHAAAVADDELQHADQINFSSKA